MKKIKKSIAVAAALLLMSSGSLHAEPKIAGTENCFAVAVLQLLFGNCCFAIVVLQLLVYISYFTSAVLQLLCCNC